MIPLQTDIRKYTGGEIIESNVIKFSHNWNMFGDLGGKLNCKYFTTIRKPEVFGFYEQKVGEVFIMELDGKDIGKALLKDATLTSVDKITPELLVLDTGTTDYKKLFEKFHVINQCVLLLFEKIEVLK